MNKLLKKASDPISFETHFIAVGISVIGLIVLLLNGMKHEVLPHLLSACILFDLSLIALYSASSIYHYFHKYKKLSVILRKIDHSMIYVLIVGTYTPVVMYCMEAPRSYYFLGVMWSVALIGILVKVLWIDAPRFISTCLYLVLGWSVLFDFSSFSTIPMRSLILIALGGISYTIGAIIYIVKKPNISMHFGFHELFHIFVMLGSFLHYIAIIMLVF